MHFAVFELVLDPPYQLFFVLVRVVADTQNQLLFLQAHSETMTRACELLHSANLFVPAPLVLVIWSLLFFLMEEILPE